MNQKNKRVGGTEFFIELVIAVFIIVMIAFALAITSSTLRSSSTISGSGVVYNESGFGNNTGYTLSKATLDDFAGTIMIVVNSTANTTINKANITLSASGVVTNSTAVSWNNLLITYNYTFSADKVTLNLINNYTAGLTSIATYIPTWLILGGLVVVIGIIVVLILVIMRIRRVSTTQESYAM